MGSALEVAEAEQESTAQQLWLLQKVCSREHGNGQKGELKGKEMVTLAWLGESKQKKT